MPHSPTPDTPPVVLTLGGNDPTGGAGLAADIQTLSSLGCHPAPVITAVTAQDTHGVKQFAEEEKNRVREQLLLILEKTSFCPGFFAARL